MNNVFLYFFFFNDTATTEIYTLSLHDALPISTTKTIAASSRTLATRISVRRGTAVRRSEEHTSELQSQSNLVCRLLLEKKKKTKQERYPTCIYLSLNPPTTILHQTSTMSRSHT